MSGVPRYENTFALCVGIYEVLTLFGNSTLLPILKPNLDFYRDDVISETF